MIAPIFSFAQGWERTNGPYGGDVFAFLKNENEIFTGSIAGIFYTNNEGNSWQHIFETDTIFDLKKHNNLLLAGSESDLYISNDNGASWSISNDGLDGNQVYCIESDNNNIFIGTSLGVYKSIDNGTSWSYSSIGIPSSKVNDFEFFGSDIYAATNSGLYKSINEGFTWSLITNLPTPFLSSGGELYHQPIHLTSSSSSIFVSLYSENLYYSDDSGVSWNNISPIESGSPIIAGAPIKYLNGTLYLGTRSDYSLNGSGWFFTSYDNGSTWSKEFLTSSSYSIDVDESNIYVSCREGVIKSAISSSYYWENVGMGIANNVNSLISINNTLHAGTAAGVYFSSDNGSSWLRAKYNFPWIVYGPNGQAMRGPQRSDNIQSNGNIYLTTPETYSNGSNVSASCVSNDGINYVMSNSNLSTLNGWLYTTRSSILHNNQFYLNDAYGIYKSPSATNWSIVNSTLQQFPNDHLSSFGSSYPLLYATYENDIYISTDDASNFTLSKIDGGDILFCQSNEVFSSVNDWPGSFDNSCMYYSDDYGSSWTSVNNLNVSQNSSNTSINALTRYNGNYFIGTGKNYINNRTQLFKFNDIFSPDYLDISSGLGDCYHTSDLTEHNGFLYSAVKCTYQPNGVFRYNENTVSIDFSHEQEDMSKSLVKIVDILGREIHQESNTLLFYIYDDGSIEKKIIIEY